MCKYLSLDFGKEVFGVVIVVLIIGVLLHYGSLAIYGAHDLNDMKVYCAHLVVIGAMTHLVCEMTGINTWYCKNGIACDQ